MKLVVLLFFVLSCQHPAPEVGSSSGLIHCGTQAISQCAPGAVPAVNECLSGTGDADTCLMGLISPATCVTEQVIACLVRHEGAAADRVARANPSDSRDARRSARAADFLAKRGYQFAD